MLLKLLAGICLALLGAVTPHGGDRDRHHPGPTPSPTPTQSQSPPPPPPPSSGGCTLSVPDDPLSAQGLATPYVLAGQCHESDPNSNAFVQGMVLDRTTGQVSLYNPLVVDRGSQPAIPPVVPALPSRRVVGIWVGFNGNTLSLVGRGRRACVQGVRGSVFGQNAFCNAGAFYGAVHAAITAGQLVVPPLGTSTKDGKPCPTARDFSIVDQDQSDNTTTTYLVAADGRIAQNTPANAANLAGATVIFNGSDERLTSIAVDKALGCTPWKVPDLADTTKATLSPAWPLNEVFAGIRQAPPVALIPALDPFAQVNGTPSLRKLNLYRAGVDQPLVSSLAAADTKSYCQDLLRTGLPRIAADKPFTSVAASPFPDQANTLFNFLALRYNATFSNLTCDTFLNVANPVTLTTMDGIVVDATINLNPGKPVASAARTN
jgi:hypothetical protein